MEANDRQLHHVGFICPLRQAMEATASGAVLLESPGHREGMKDTIPLIRLVFIVSLHPGGAPRLVVPQTGRQKPFTPLGNDRVFGYCSRTAVGSHASATWCDVMVLQITALGLSLKLGAVTASGAKLGRKSGGQTRLVGSVHQMIPTAPEIVAATLENS